MIGIIIDKHIYIQITFHIFINYNIYRLVLLMNAHVPLPVYAYFRAKVKISYKIREAGNNIPFNRNTMYVPSVN